MLQLQNPIQLCFFYSDITDAGVSSLKSIETLTDIEFRHTGITDKSLASMTYIKSLRRVTLAEENITFDGVSRLLRQLPKLKSLRLDGTLIGLDAQQEQALRKANPRVTFQIR